MSRISSRALLHTHPDRDLSRTTVLLFPGCNPVFGIQGPSWFLGVVVWGALGMNPGILGALGFTATFVMIVTIIPFMPHGWAESADGFPAMFGRLIMRGKLAKLANANAFTEALKPLRRMNWFVYAKRPFAGPKAVLAYLSRYTHRVAISNTRLLAHDERGVTFRYKDYRTEGSARQKIMTLAADGFIRRKLIHVLPKGEIPVNSGIQRQFENVALRGEAVAGH
jgi:hypothetical protein